MSDDTLYLRETINALTKEHGDLDKRFTAHDQVCTERQGEIKRRLSRIERLLWYVGTAVILLQLDIIKTALHTILHAVQ